MILTDIEVPAFAKTFDFKLDENRRIASVIDEIVGILAQEAREDSQKIDAHDYTLCSLENRKILPADRTLAECGIGNGSRLMLV